MLNQLPKNLSQNNINPLTSYNNEKHLNLIDSVQILEKPQEERIINFILVLSIILGISVSCISYINLTNTKSFNIGVDTQLNIDYLKIQETKILELNKDTEYLKRFKNAKDTIKNKQSIFYTELRELITFLGDPIVKEINFMNENNQFSFQIILYFRNQSIEEKIKEYANKSKITKNLKIENIEKISESNEIKYTISGVIDGR